MQATEVGREGQMLPAGARGVTLVALRLHGLASWVLRAPIPHDGFWGLHAGGGGGVCQLGKGSGEVRWGRLARVVRHTRRAHAGGQLLHGDHLRAVHHGVPALAPSLNLRGSPEQRGWRLRHPLAGGFPRRSDIP